jgi:hypothetical protein
VQEAEDLVRGGHIADPCVPSGVFDAITEASEDEHNNKHRVWRVDCDDYVRGEMRAWTDESDAALSDFHMDEVVEESRSGVPDQGGEEDE